MSSTNKTSLGLNMWEASDKPVRQDFVNDNVIVNEKITKLNSDIALKANSSDLKYQIIDLEGADLVTLPAGRWCVNNGAANGESGGWFAEVIEFDDAYRTLFACPYDDSKKYFYRAKRVFGAWKGWEKYTSVI